MSRWVAVGVVLISGASALVVGVEGLPRGPPKRRRVPESIKDVVLGVAAKPRARFLSETVQRVVAKANRPAHRTLRVDRSGQPCEPESPVVRRAQERRKHGARTRAHLVGQPIGNLATSDLNTLRTSILKSGKEGIMP